jgi:hypothetical protein
LDRILHTLLLTTEKNFIENERKMPILDVFFERQQLILQPNTFFYSEATIIMPNISISEDFVASYSTWMHINGALSFLMFLLCLYLILFKTPSSMSEYKWYLVNLVVWALVFDIYTTILYMPLPLFPVDWRLFIYFFIL